MNWKDTCKPIIAKVLSDNKHATEKDLQKALSDAYPFKIRNPQPYKTWCNEIKSQRKELNKENDDQINLF